jgi:multiple sugar transport system substrate-binding protein
MSGKLRTSLVGLMIVLMLAISLAPTLSQDQVTVRFWQHNNTAFNDSTEALGAAYMAANPNVVIEFESFPYNEFVQALQTSMPAGTEADVLQLFGSWVCNYAAGGRLHPVPESVMTVDQAREIFYEAPIDGYICPGPDGTMALYGLPQEFNVEMGAAIVNTQIAADMGVELPDPTSGWDSWDAFIADAGQFVEGDASFMTRSGFNFATYDQTGFLFMSLIKQQGGEFYDEATGMYNFETDEARAALELIVSMVAEHNLTNPDLFGNDVNWIGDSFSDGTSVMGSVGPWVVPCCITGDYKEAVQYIPLPSLAEDPIFAADSGWGLTVSVNAPAEVQEAAWDFIAFVAANAANALQWNVGSGTLPALKSIVEDEAMRAQLVEPQPYIEAFLEIFPYGEYIGRVPDRDRLFVSIIYPHAYNAMLGIESIDEALTLMTIDGNS